MAGKQDLPQRSSDNGDSKQPELRLRLPKRQPRHPPPLHKPLSQGRNRLRQQDSTLVREQDETDQRTPRKTATPRRNPDLSARAGAKVKTINSRGSSPKGLALKKAEENVDAPDRETSRRRDSSSKRKTRQERDSDRKSRERKQKERQRMFQRVGIAALAVALVGALTWGGFALADSNLFSVDSIQIEGTRFLSNSDVEKIAALGENSSVLRLNTTEVEERLSANPWVLQAEVARQMPNEVQVVLHERTPAVFVASGDELWAASSDGRWLGIYQPESGQILDPTGTLGPVSLGEISLIEVEEIPEPEPQWGALIEEEVLSNVLAHLRGLDAGIVSRIQRVTAFEVGRTSLFTVDGVELDVGRADHLSEKSQIILTILEEQAGNVVLINVRSIDSPTWRGLSR